MRNILSRLKFPAGQRLFSICAFCFWAAGLGLTSTVSVYAQDAMQDPAPVSAPVSVQRSIPQPMQTIEAGQILDKTPIFGGSPDWDANAFTVAMRFRPLGPGSDPTSGNGMLFIAGSGWFDGFRAYYDYSQGQKVHFQIGRAKEQSAVQVVSRSAPPYGILCDMVCTYDGRMLRLYLNGELEGETEFTDGLSPKPSRLSIGSGSYGVGSVKMFVDRAEYWNRALDADFVKARFAAHPKEEKEKIALWSSFNFTEKLDDFDRPVQDLERLTQMVEVPYSLHETLLNRLIADGNWQKALPCLVRMSRDWMDREVPENETLPQENARISDAFTLIRAWEKVPAGLKTAQTTEVKEVRRNFLKAASKERVLLKKIFDFDAQMTERTRKIEAQTVKNWETLCSRRPTQVRKFWLSPNGCDENPGTLERPFQSLKKSLETAAALQEKGISSEILVLDGTYQCRETAELLRDALIPNLKAVIRVRPAEGAKPIFTFGQDLRGFQPVTDPAILRRLPESARSEVRVVSLLRNGVADFGALGDRGYPVMDQMKPWTDLYVNGKPMQIARYPNAGEDDLQIGEVVPGPNYSEKNPDTGTFHCEDPRVAGWKWTADPVSSGSLRVPNVPNAQSAIVGNDIWAYGLWRWEWASHTVPVKSFDPQTKLLTVDAQTNGRFTFHFLNVLEELDQPGEYYLDRRNGLIYLIPPKGIELANARVDFPLTDASFLRLKNVQNLILEGLHFTCTRGTAVWMENCESVYFNHGTVSRCGVHAFVMNGGHDCGVYGSRIESVGSCGVRVAGGDRDTLEPCRHFVTNCFLRDFCRIDRSYAPAVHAKGVGIILTQNLICDSPHHAFRTEGNDLLIARNEVHSVVYDFSDQSGIDIYCDPTYRGIVINENFWHHIGSKLAICGQAGIRLDDSISGVLMRGNVFYRSSGGFFGGIQIHGGKDNLILRNLFLDCQTGLSFTPWFNGRYLDQFVDGSFNARIQPYQELGIYPFMEEVREHINRNYVLENGFVDCGTFIGRGNHRHQLCVGNRSFTPRTELSIRENGLASPQELRRWIETIPGHSLKNVGIQPCPLFPEGQEGIRHDVSPNYFSE